MPEIKIYTEPMSSQCIRVKEFLNFKDVEFEEVNVDEQEVKDKEVSEAIRNEGAPVTSFGDETVIGFDRERIDELVDRKIKDPVN